MACHVVVLYRAACELAFKSFRLGQINRQVRLAALPERKGAVLSARALSSAPVFCYRMCISPAFSGQVIAIA
jgi:hypothetical protein